MIGTRSIRRRLLLSLAVMAAILLSVYLPLADRLIDHRFESFEIDEAQDEARRLELLLGERIDRLRTHAIDYADWALTADYVRGIGADYIENNVYTDILTNFDSDYFFILDRDLSIKYFGGTAAYAGGGEESLELKPLPASKLTPILADARVRGLLEKAGSAGFAAQIDGRWHLIGISAVTYPGTDDRKPIYGVLGFASEMTPQRIERIAQVVGVPFSFSDRLKDPPESRLEAGDVVMHRVLHDDRGLPMVALDMRYRQPLADEIQDTRRLFLWAAIGIFLIGSFLLWWLVDRGLISRLERVHEELKSIRSGDAEMISLSGRWDEVDHLASEFNHAYAEINRINHEWRHEALHDSLTGLGNRAKLIQAIEAYARTEQDLKPPLWLMLIDLDGFKTINDVFGHSVGDSVLVHVADRLRNLVPQASQCFRLGGDEFAVLAFDFDRHGIRELADGINRSIGAADFTDRGRGTLSASIGIAGDDSADAPLEPSELMQRADIALYTIKRRNRDGNALFDDSMLDEMQGYNDVLFRLRDAIGNDRIEVHFQPIIDAISGQPCSFEALARWHDADLGWVEASHFVAVAEQNFLCCELDQLVLRKALSAMPALRASAPNAGLSINASVQSLFDQDYIALVSQQLNHFDYRGDVLRIEITETALAANEATLSRTLSMLQSLGARLELDDFGVGYSSLSRLTQIAPSAIKLDASFLRNRHLDGGRACRAVIGLARELGIAVIGESVETEEDIAFLRACGCDAMQGNAYSPPLPLQDMLEWLRQSATSDATPTERRADIPL